MAQAYAKQTPVATTSTTSDPDDQPRELLPRPKRAAIDVAKKKRELE
jgi:hypothetical protein